MTEWWGADPVAAPEPSAAPQGPLRITVRPKGVEDPPLEAPPSKSWWGSDPVGTAPMSMAEDVVKSGAIGPVKGAIGLLGLPGDLAEQGARGIDRATRFIGGLIGVDAPTRGDRDPTYGSGDIRKGVEKVIDTPLYEPKTRAGRYAQAVGEFVPAAATGPGGLLRNIITSAVVPGIASEAAGEATHGTKLEPWARAGAAVLGGVGASTLSRPSTAASAIRGEMPAYVTPQHVTQAEALIADAAHRGVQLTWPEALSQVTGRPVLTDMQRVLESSGQTRARMQEVHGGRPQEIATAAEHEFGNVAPATNVPDQIGPAVGRAADEHIQGVRQTINDASDPFYAASSTVRLTPAEMAHVHAVPGFAEARAAVRGDAQLNRHVAHLPDDSVGFLNEVKKYLDNAARTETLPATQRPNMQRAAGYGTDATTVRDAAVSASGRATPPVNTYEIALQIQEQGRRRFLDPLLQGRLGKMAEVDLPTQRAIDALFPKNPLFGSAEEVTEAVAALSARNPWAARQLVRAHLDQQLDQAFNKAGRGQEAAQFAGATFAHGAVGSSVIGTQRMQNLRAAVEALPNGPQIWDGLGRFLEIAQATGTRQPIGSKTAFNAQLLEDMSTGSAAGNVAKLGVSPGKWWTWASDAMKRWQLGQNLDQLAHIITDPNSGRILERIARAPVNSQESRLLAARIIASSTAARSENTPAQKRP